MSILQPADEAYDLDMPVTHDEENFFLQCSLMLGNPMARNHAAGFSMEFFDFYRDNGNPVREDMQLLYLKYILWYDRESGKRKS